MKRLFLLAFILLLLLALTLPVYAEESDAEGEVTEQLPEEFWGLLDSLPEEIRALLPEGFFTLNQDAAGGAVSEMGDFSYLLGTLLSLVGLRLSDCAAVLASVSGLLLFAALLRALRDAFPAAGVGQAFSFCSVLAITLALLSQSYRALSSAVEYFETLRKMTSATLPLLGGLYLSGGNAGAAVASTAGLSAYMVVLEQLVARSILPFCGICMAFALMNALDPSVRTGTLLSTLKKNYTTVLTFLMMLLLTMLGAQTTLGARRDSLAMRSFKFAAGNWIPVVGGSVGELLRTVSAGVGYMRGTVGICGVLLLLLTLLPTLVELFLMRFVWQLCASFADLLGCDGEKRLLEEFASLLGYLIAAVSICSSVLVLAFTLLAHCASALG